MLAVTATIPVGKAPSGVAVSPDGIHAYATNRSDHTVSVINTTTNIVTTIPVGYFPDGVAVSPDGTHLYVTNGGDNTVSVIDTGSGAVTAIPVGGYPTSVAVSPDGTHAYVINHDDDTVSVINTTNAVSTIPVGGVNPGGLAVSPDGTHLYVTSGGGAYASTVSVIDTGSGAVTTISLPVSAYPDGVAVSPDGSLVYVTNFGAGTMSVIDITPSSPTHNTVTATIPVGTEPDAVAVSPDGAPLSMSPISTFTTAARCRWSTPPPRTSRTSPSGRARPVWRSAPTGPRCTSPTPSTTRCRCFRTRLLGAGRIIWSVNYSAASPPVAVAGSSSATTFTRSHRAPSRWPSSPGQPHPTFAVRSKTAELGEQLRNTLS